MRTKKTVLITLIVSLFLVTSTTLTVANNITPPISGERTIPLEELQQFTRVIRTINQYYVKDVDDNKLFENAIGGMLSGLDPHSAYLGDDEFSDLKVATSGQFGGLGLEVTMDNGFIKVVSPIDDTPAAKAGIKPGDLIIKIDDTPVKGLSLREAVDKMRGEKGSKVTLTIVREGEDKPIIMTLERAMIKVKSVKSKLLDGNYGYLRITNFQNNTATNAKVAINDLKKQANGQLKGLVLDLRNNPGGLLEGAVDISALFLNPKQIGHNKIIVYTEGRIPESRINEIAKGHDQTGGIPIVVLVNEGSASAAEIVAGALQDHKRAVVVGTKTFGKGSVQTVIPLSDKSGLKLTTAFYYTPAGRSIQAEGIEPDIIIKNMEIKEQDDLPNVSIREADLSRHLVNDKTEHAESTTSEVIKNDYQLNEAVNILKALAIHNKQQKQA